MYWLQRKVKLFNVIIEKKNTQTTYIPNSYKILLENCNSIYNSQECGWNRLNFQFKLRVFVSVCWLYPVLNSIILNYFIHLTHFRITLTIFCCYYLNKTKFYDSESCQTHLAHFSILNNFFCKHFYAIPRILLNVEGIIIKIN